MAAIKNFQSSLLREKFVIFDPKVKDTAKTPIIALSNRMVISLKTSEEYIIRAQNMHSCVRFAARIIQSFNMGGSLLNRVNGFDWDAALKPIINDYERKFNENRWIAVYHKGKILFESGTHHPFLDVIEKCDFENGQNYDNAVPLAEAAFKKTGKNLKIDYDANVALVATFEKNEGRCGVILRGAYRTTTFTFNIIGTKKISMNIPQCLSACAAYLEGIQLAFMIGMNIYKMRVGIIKRHSDLERQTKEAQRRLGRLNTEITNLHDAFDVRYRPEKPEFYRILNETEELAIKVIEIPEEEPKPFGEADTVEEE